MDRPGGFIVLQLFSNWVTKEWPPARFAALVRQLRDRYRVPILVLAGRAESSRLERLQALADGSLTALRDVPVDELTPGSSSAAWSSAAPPTSPRRSASAT